MNGRPRPKHSSSPGSLPSPMQMRQFGAMFGAVVALLFGLFFPWLFDQPLNGLPWIIAGVFWTLAIVLPLSLKPFYTLWMKFGVVVGFINTRIIMLLIYYLVFVPIGTLMRIMGRDTLARNVNDPTQTSYRVESAQRSRDHFERPY